MTNETITVDRKALHTVLQALVGPGHLIRELQHTRSLHKMGHPNPIDTLIEQYEAGGLLPEASPATKGQCNDERACGACFSGQGQCETAAPATVHPDDAAVDALAAAMKEKLARQRAKGYGGWDTDCTQQRLSDLLRGHIDKGDPVDVANFCAFLLARGEDIAAAPPSTKLTPTDMQWAEDLIRQLPESHEGRNSWLLNWGAK